MVPDAYNHGGVPRDGRRALACHPRKPRTELLQPSQAKGRFGEPEVSPSCFFGSDPVVRRYLRRKFRYPVFDGQD
jgi:hypothetical protein